MWSEILFSANDAAQSRFVASLPSTAYVGEVENGTKRNADDDASNHSSRVFRSKRRCQPSTEDTECLGAPDDGETEDHCESNSAEDVSNEFHENLLSRNNLHGEYHAYIVLSNRGIIFFNLDFSLSS